MRSTDPVPGRGAGRRAVDPRDGLRRGLRDPVGGGRDAVPAHPADHRAGVGGHPHGRSAGRVVLRRALTDELEARAARRLGGDRRRRAAPSRRSSRAPAALDRRVRLPDRARDRRRRAAARSASTSTWTDDGPPRSPTLFALDRRRSPSGRSPAPAARVARRATRPRTPRDRRARARRRATGANVMPALIDAARAGATRRRDVGRRSARCSGSSGSRTRGERAARGTAGARPHPLRGRARRRRRCWPRSAPTSIKVEVPPAGDPYRVQGTERVGDESVLFMSLNSGKRSVALGLPRARGRRRGRPAARLVRLPRGERAARAAWRAHGLDWEQRARARTRDRLRLDLGLRRRRARRRPGAGST